MRRGQALVEFALVMVVALFAARGFIEAGFLMTAYFEQARATGVVADWAARHPGEHWAVVAERELPGCDLTVTEPLLGLIEVGATCRYQPVATSGLWDGLPISTHAEAAS